jgi:hypothetical protein
MHIDNLIMASTICVTEEMFKKFTAKLHIAVLLVYGLFTQFSL